MKIGILTSGGDCPGLNAVIRGAVLNGVISHDAEFVGFRWGWKGVVEADIMPITRHDVRGLSKQGGTILGSSRTNPFEGEGGGPENIQRMLDEHGIDAIIAIGGEGTLTAARRLLRRGRHQGRRRAEDHRQRPRGHRLLVRLRHGRRDRDRGDRPPAHHRRLARPLHGARGHGPPRRLDRAALGHGRRRARDPHPRAAAVDRADLRVGRVGARPRPGAARRRRRGLHARRHGARRTRTRASTRSTARASAASPSCSHPSSRSAPASSRAPRCSGTSSAAARRARTTACSRPASAWPRSTRSTTGRGARW